MFAVIYRLKIKQGLEEQFERCWVDITHEFRQIHGGLGSCLHKSENGDYVAYARWPNRKAWERNKEIKNIESMKLMKESIEVRHKPIPLEIEKDLLVGHS